MQGHLGAGTTQDSNKNDYYITPTCMTKLLLNQISSEFDDRDTFYDPACGEKDNIMTYFRTKYNFCFSRDLIYGDDFLLDKEGFDIDWIITNPPYKLKAEFLRHALDFRPSKGVIFLVPTRWKFSLEFFKILEDYRADYHLNTEFTFNRQLELSDTETEGVKAGMALYSWMVFTGTHIEAYGYPVGSTILDIQPHIIKKGRKER